MTDFEYGVRVAVKLTEGVVAGNILFINARPTDIEQAQNKAYEIARNIDILGQLTLIDPENERMYITFSKEVLSRYPVFVSAYSKILHKNH